MSSFKLGLLLLVFVKAFFLLSFPVHCDTTDEDDKPLLDGINRRRQSLKIPPLTPNKKADCLAGEFNEQYSDSYLTCENVSDHYNVFGIAPNFPNLRNHIEDDCGINISTTKDGVILPICVPNLFSNYTNFDAYGRFLNDAKYAGIGLDTDDDWVVVVLSTNTSTGSFSGASSSAPGHYNKHMKFMFMFGLFLVWMS